MTNNVSEYGQIKDYEHHFNNLEMEIRKFASAWLLVALGAIAFIFRGGIDNPLLAPKVLIAIVCLMGNIGLVTLWVLDQLVYHRLLNAVFLLGLRMEYLDPNVPPIRTLMMLYSRKRGMARYLRLYYLIPMAVLACIAFVAVIWHIIEKREMSDWSVSLALLAPAGSLLLLLWTWWKSRRLESYDEIATGFADADFTAYLRNNQYEAILRKRKGGTIEASR